MRLPRPLPTVAMNLVPEAAALEPQMRDWRHHLHAHPETAFEEVRTSKLAAERLSREIPARSRDELEG